MSVTQTLYQWYIAYFQRSDRETASSGIRELLGYANTTLVPQQTHDVQVARTCSERQFRMSDGSLTEVHCNGNL